MRCEIFKSLFISILTVPSSGTEKHKDTFVYCFIDISYQQVIEFTSCVSFTERD